MTALFDSAKIIFEKSSALFTGDEDNTKLPYLNPTFGILKFQATKIASPDKLYHVVFTVDRSGSMSDICSDGRTKQQHILHTLKNMCWFFHDHPHIRVRVSIFTFDDEVVQILDKVIITSENINGIIHQIDTIRPRGGTDIGLALQTVREFIQDIRLREIDSETNHIFMTDGDATNGEMKPEVLKTFVDNNYTNVFVGFGIDHNDEILSGLGSHFNSAYYFIDKLENSGLVYGEILHSLLYKLLFGSTLHIDNGYLYDFKTNSWTKRLYIGDIVGEANKTYHIISEEPSKCDIHINAKKFSDSQDSVFIKFGDVVFEDNLTCYVFRQKTLRLLHEVKDFSKKSKMTNHAYDNTAFNFKFNYIDTSEIKQNKTPLKAKLNTLMEDMKKYMKENDLESDNFMKNLCDDVYICYRTFDTNYSGMYTTARLTSQGTQRCYAVTEVEVETNKNAMFSRGGGSPSFSFQDYQGAQPQDQDPFLSHEVSNFDDTPYSTPIGLEVMYSVSTGVSTGACAGDSEGVDDDDVEPEEFYQIFRN